MLAIPFPFHTRVYVVYRHVKNLMESQLVRLLTRIDNFKLPRSSSVSGAVHYCCSSILGEFCDRGSTGIEVSYQRSVVLKLPIDSDRLQVRSLG